MNNNFNYDSAQSVLAKLVTMPHLCEKINEDADKILGNFLLLDHDKVKLLQFFKTYSVKFIASSRLLKKKRWDDVCEAMQLFKHVVAPDELAISWDNYLRTLDIKADSPKNPLIESVNFCTYLLNEKIFEGYVINELIKYEIVRNNVIINYSNDTTSYLDKFHTEINYNLDRHNTVLFVHPCAQISVFNINISYYIDAAYNNKLSKADIERFTPEKQTIICYKNWKNGGVATIKTGKIIQDIVYEILNVKHISIDALLTRFNQFNESDILNLIKKLTDAGIILPIYKMSCITLDALWRS